MKWRVTAWEAAAPVFERIKALPFIRELAAGTLPYRKFLYYLGQDSIYLKEYGQLMSVMASRFDEPDNSRLFMKFAGDNLDSEKALHESYSACDGAEASPTTLSCISHLRHQVTEEPVEVALASVLPCFTVYEKAGKFIYENAVTEGNPYRAWIEMYGGDTFDDSTERLLELCDEYAVRASSGMRDRMTLAFREGVESEWKFWNSAYLAV